MAISHPKTWYRKLKRRLSEQTQLNWRWLFLRIVHDASDRARRFDIASDSRALSFNFILSLVPLLAIGFTFFNMIGGLKLFVENTLKPLLEKNFPAQVANQLKSFIDGFVGNLQTGTLGVVSFVTLLATVIALMMNIEQSFNRIFDARDRRPLLKRLGGYWIMLSATPLIIVLSTAKSSELINAIRSQSGFLNQFGFVAFVTALTGHIFQIIGFGSLFVVLPERKPRLIAAFWGAITTHLIFQLLAAINVQYATFVFSNRTNLHLYGSLPLLVLVFLIWVRLVWLGILFGACICAAVDRYLDSVSTATERKPWHAPHDTILNCVRTLEHYIQTFKLQKRPLAQGDLAALLDLAADELEEHQQRLERKGLILPIRFEDHECYTATAAALTCSQDPQKLIADLMEIPLENISTVGLSAHDDLLAAAKAVLAGLLPAEGSLSRQ